MGLKIAITTIIAGTILLFLTIQIPTTKPKIQKVDAIFIHAGGDGERLEYGTDLLNSGYSKTLILNKGINWDSPTSMEVKRLCDNGYPNPDLKIICIVALPDSTKGEAMTVSKIAESHGWTRLLIVTNDYHIFRASKWFNRCFNGHIIPIGTLYKFKLKLLVREAAAIVHTLLIDRKCI